MSDIRRNIFYNIKNSPKQIKALALLLYVKHKYKSSAITQYSHNKLHLITGLHINTIKSRMKTLESMNMIRKDKKVISFKKVQSDSKHRNVDLSKIVYDSVKTIEKSLYATYVVEIQKHKDFVKHSIHLAHNGSSLEEVKKARKDCKRYGYGNEYMEYGLSYHTIAKRLNVSLQKAFNVVKFACENKMLEKKNNIKQVFLKNAEKFILYTNYNKYTFYTKNNIYIIKANTYSIPS